MARKSISTEKIYINERLERELNRITEFPLSVLEAPMGYGKTSVLREYLNRTGLKYVRVRALPDAGTYFWERFCDALAAVREQVGGELKRAGFPRKPEDMYRMADRIAGLGQSGGTVILIDDYHAAGDADEWERFFACIAGLQPENLHILLSGRRRFAFHREELMMKRQMYVIGEESLRMEAKDIRDYYALCGRELRYRQAVRLAQKSGGWPAAVCIAMRNNGAAEDGIIPVMVTDLLEQSVISVLTEKQMDILLRVCAFTRFTEEQARFVCEKDDPVPILRELERNCCFVGRDPDQVFYEINSLLIDCLRKMLDSGDAGYRRDVYRRAADWFYRNREFGRAAYAYYCSGSFEEMLQAYEQDGGGSPSGYDIYTMIRIFRTCPDEIRRRHPLAGVIFARQLKMAGEEEMLSTVMETLSEYEADAPLQEKDRKTFQGERKLLDGFLSYSNVDEMTASQLEAADLLEGPSATVLRRSLTAFGSPSLFYLHHSRPGRADTNLDLLNRSRAAYYRVTDDNARGSEYLLEAELHFCRGSMYRADILANKAMSIAEQYQQIEIQISALFLHARIAMLTSATEEGASAMRSLRKLAGNSPLYLATCDMCEASIYAVFNQISPIAAWIAEGQFRHEYIPGVYPVVLNYLNIVYGKILLDQRLYTKYLGLSSIMMEEAGKAGHLLTVIYLHIYDAIAYEKLEMAAQSEASIRKAVALAGQDGLCIPFAENGSAASNLLKKTKFTGSQEEFAAECVRIASKYERNLNVLLSEAGMSPLSMLTRREQEISLLVAEGKTNLQIANELNIAEITVKKSLSNIYARLGVSNRTSLLNKIK